MLEIAILVILAGKLGKIVESKGRKKIGYQLLLIGTWLGAEFFGGVVGGIIGALTDSDAPMLIAVVLGYGCAIGAAVILFQIAKNLSPVESEEDYYRSIEYADRLRIGEHFRAQAVSPPPATDAYMDSPENLPQSDDGRIQEKPHTEPRGSSGS